MNFATTMPTGLTGAAYERAVLGAEIPPVGLAVHGCEVAILDPDGNELALGTAGEVGIRGHSLMSRYLGDDAATDAALGSGWLRTGDIGRLDVGEFASSPLLTLVGRQKNVAKCNGLSISLEEIDRAALAPLDTGSGTRADSAASKRYVAVRLEGVVLR